MNGSTCSDQFPDVWWSIIRSTRYVSALYISEIVTFILQQTSILEHRLHQIRNEAAEADQKAPLKTIKRNAFQYGKPEYRPTVEKLAKLHIIKKGGDIKILNTITWNQKTIDHTTPIVSKNTETTKAIGISKETEITVIVTILKDMRIDQKLDGKINAIHQGKGDRMAIEEGIEAMATEQGITLKDLRGKVRKILKTIKTGQIVLLRIEWNSSIIKEGNTRSNTKIAEDYCDKLYQI